MAISDCLQLCFLLLCIESVFTELYEGSPCTLENNETGVCKLLMQCPPRIEEVRQGRRNAQSSRCGFSGFEEIVCCPSKIKEKIGIRPADLACHQYTNEIWAETLSYHILGGTEASAQEFPYTVALGYRDKSKLPANATKYTCGGTIIADKFILTAAHCVNNIDRDIPILVRAGAENLLENEGAQIVEVAEIISHPKYKRSVVYNDIALIKLSAKFKWTLTVKPICLMSKPMDQVELSSNISFVVTGWGATDINAKQSNRLMRTPSLELVPSSTCTTSYARSRRLPNGLDDKVLCAKDKDSTRRADACQGDSGGPLLMMDTEGDTVIGVTSFGQSCGTLAPGVYTSVYRYLDWIESTVWPDPVSDSDESELNEFS